MATRPTGMAMGEEQPMGTTPFPQGLRLAAFGWSAVAISYFWGIIRAPLSQHSSGGTSHCTNNAGGFSSPAINGDSFTASVLLFPWPGLPSHLPLLHLIARCLWWPRRGTSGLSTNRGSGLHCWPSGRTPDLFVERQLLHLGGLWQSPSKCTRWSGAGVTNSRAFQGPGLMNWAGCDLTDGSIRLSECQKTQV